MKTYFILVILLFSSQGWGENPAPKSTASKDGKKSTESLSFSGLMLKGQLKKPDLSYIYKRRGLRAEQIVNIPENFDEEILQGSSEF